MEKMTCYLGLGANLGDRMGQLVAAVEALRSEAGVEVVAVSGVYETVAVAEEAQPDYLNLAVALETDLEPLELLRVCQEIERRLGRTRPYHHAPRTIDIDLLDCGGIMARTEELTLPHPRMLQRQFVLAPLAEIAPGLRVEGKVVGELVDRSDPEVRRVGPLNVERKT